MSEKNIAQQAIDKLKQALFDKGSYLHLIASREKVILQEDNEYVTQVAQLLKKIESTEKDYANIRAQQNWASYIINTALSSPEYKAYQARKQELELSITKLQQEYIDSTQQQTAQQISEKLLPDVITPTLITAQIKHMEDMFSRYYSGGTNQYYFNIPTHDIAEPDGQDAHEQEKTLIKEYQTLLAISVTQDIKNIFKSMLPKADDEKQQQHFDKLITSFFENQDIKNLLNNYANLYAKRIFCEINQKLYSDFGTVNLETTNIKFFQTELNNVIAEQNLFLTKITLLCQQTIQDKYIIKKDTEDTKHLEQILQDIEQLTPTELYDFIKKAKDKFYKIPNYQLLSPKQQEQFINKFIFIEYQTFLNNQKGVEAALIEQKINSLIAETNKQIETAQIAASNTPQPPTINLQPNLIQQITGWSTEPVVSTFNSTLKQDKDAAYPLYSEAIEIYYKIAGVDRLSTNENDIFIKQIAITLGTLTKQAENLSWTTWVLNKSYNGIKSLFYSLPGLPPLLQDNIRAIQNAIHTTFATQEKIKIKIEHFKQIYQTNEINDDKIKTKLEQDFAAELINFKKNKFNISPTPPFTEEESKKDPAVALKTRLDHIVNRIEIAKILTSINSFNDIPLQQQLIYIDNINKYLAEISLYKQKILQLKEQATTAKNTEKDIIKYQQNIQQKQQEIKDIIVKIHFYSQNFTKLRTDFNITDETFNPKEELMKLWQTDEVKNILAGAVAGIAIVAAVPALNTFISSIPVIGPIIASTTTNVSVPLLAAGAMLGAMAGTIIPVRKIFKPITYVFEELSDIWQNPNKNSYVDRAIRATAILAPVAAAVVGVGFALAAVANPFSGPVIAGILAGTVATFAVSSLCGWVASKLCKTVREINAYEQKQADNFCKDNYHNNVSPEEKAKALSEFFAKNIKEYSAKLQTAAGTYKVNINNILYLLQKTWKKITENQDPEPEWSILLKSLYYDKAHGYQTQLEDQVKIADNITDQLIELVDTPKCVKSRELDQAKLDLINKKQQAAISFKDTTANQLNSFIKQPHEELENLYKISSIIKNRNSK